MGYWGLLVLALIAVPVYLFGRFVYEHRFYFYPAPVPIECACAGEASLVADELSILQQLNDHRYAITSVVVAPSRSTRCTTPARTGMELAALARTGISPSSLGSLKGSCALLGNGPQVLSDAKAYIKNGGWPTVSPKTHAASYRCSKQIGKQESKKNAPKDLGAFIDAHNTVLRMNSAPTGQRVERLTSIVGKKPGTRFMNEHYWFSHQPWWLKFDDVWLLPPVDKLPGRRTWDTLTEVEANEIGNEVFSFGGDRFYEFAKRYPQLSAHNVELERLRYDTADWLVENLYAIVHAMDEELRDALWKDLTHRSATAASYDRWHTVRLLDSSNLLEWAWRSTDDVRARKYEWGGSAGLSSLAIALAGCDSVAFFGLLTPTVRSVLLERHCAANGCVAIKACPASGSGSGPANGPAKTDVECDDVDVLSMDYYWSEPDPETSKDYESRGKYHPHWEEKVLLTFLASGAELQ